MTQNDDMKKAFGCWYSNTPLTMTIGAEGYTKESLEWAYQAGREAERAEIVAKLGSEETA
jgi:hypothetical protein